LIAGAAIMDRIFIADYSTTKQLPQCSTGSVDHRAQLIANLIFHLRPISAADDHFLADIRTRDT
jgi:hypothetical protein